MRLRSFGEIWKKLSDPKHAHKIFELSEIVLFRFGRVLDRITYSKFLKNYVAAFFMLLWKFW